MLNLTRVGLDAPLHAARFEDQQDFRAHQAPQHALEVLHQGVDFQNLGFEGLVAGKGQQLPRQGCGPLGRLLNLANVLALGTVGRELIERQLAVPLDEHQEVIEVVGDAARHPTHGLHLLRLADFGLRPANFFFYFP